MRKVKRSYDIHVIFTWYSSASLTPPHPAELVEHPVTAPAAPEALSHFRVTSLEMERGPLLRLEISGEFWRFPQFPRLEDHQAAAWALAGYAFDWRERCGLDTRARCKLGKLETKQTKHIEGKKQGQTHCFGCSCSFQKKLLKIQNPKISMLFQVNLCFKVSDSICIWASNNAPGASEMLMPHLSHIVTSSLVLCFNFSICFPYVFHMFSRCSNTYGALSLCFWKRFRSKRRLFQGAAGWSLGGHRAAERLRKQRRRERQSTELVTAHRSTGLPWWTGLHHFDEVKMSMFFLHVAVDSDVDFIKCKDVRIIRMCMCCSFFKFWSWSEWDITFLVIFKIRCLTPIQSTEQFATTKLSQVWFRRLGGNCFIPCEPCFLPYLCHLLPFPLKFFEVSRFRSSRYQFSFVFLVCFCSNIHWQHTTHNTQHTTTTTTKRPPNDNELRLTKHCTDLATLGAGSALHGSALGPADQPIRHLHHLHTSSHMFTVFSNSRKTT